MIFGCINHTLHCYIVRGVKLKVNTRRHVRLLTINEGFFGSFSKALLQQMLLRDFSKSLAAKLNARPTHASCGIRIQTFQLLIGFFDTPGLPSALSTLVALSTLSSFVRCSCSMSVTTSIYLIWDTRKPAHFICSVILFPLSFYFFPFSHSPLWFLST